MAADIDRLIRKVEQGGGRVVRRTKKGHWIVSGPTGTTSVPSAPKKSNRGWDNSVAGLRRIGVRID